MLCKLCLKLTPSIYLLLLPQAWEGRCGQLDQYGMKQTRLFANLCNAGLQPQALAAVLPDVPCAAA
jgi:hypothetical protein